MTVIIIESWMMWVLIGIFAVNTVVDLRKIHLMRKAEKKGGE